MSVESSSSLPDHPQYQALTECHRIAIEACGYVVLGRQDGANAEDHEPDHEPTTDCAVTDHRSRVWDLTTSLRPPTRWGHRAG
jgi:hypothetical protein